MSIHGGLKSTEFERPIVEKECPTPEPLGARVAIILFVTLLFFLTFISRVIFAPLLPIIKQELNITSGQAGSIFLVISSGFFVAQLVSGFISARFNHRGSLIISALILSFTLLAFGLTTSTTLTFILIGLIGISSGFHLPSAVASITAMVSKQDWGKALAIHQTAPVVSLILAPFVVEALIGQFSWQIILTILGVVSLIVSLTFVRFGHCGEFPGEVPKPAILKGILSMPSYWIMVVLFAVAMGGAVGTYTMLPLYLITDHGFDQSWANTLLGLSRISGLFMAFIGGWITDKIGDRKTIASVLFTTGIITIILGNVTDSLLVAIIFIQPALIACYFPAGFSALSRVAPPHLRSIATSLITPLAFLFGSGMVPTLIGYMGEIHSFGLGISLAGALMLLGPLFVLFLQLREKGEEGC